MSRRCELTGIGPMVGHNVSHSNIKTKRRFLPALSPATLQSESLGQSFKLRISNAALRTLDFKGGLDVFLLGAKDEQLSPRALKIKAQVKATAKAAAQAPYGFWPRKATALKADLTKARRVRSAGFSSSPPQVPKHA